MVDSRVNFAQQIHLHPPVRRAVEETVSALKKAGHNVVPWEPYKHEYAVNTLIGKVFGADGGAVSPSLYTLNFLRRTMLTT